MACAQINHTSRPMPNLALVSRHALAKLVLQHCDRTRDQRGRRDAEQQPISHETVALPRQTRQTANMTSSFAPSLSRRQDVFFPQSKHGGVEEHNKNIPCTKRDCCCKKLATERKTKRNNQSMIIEVLMTSVLANTSSHLSSDERL